MLRRLKDCEGLLVRLRLRRDSVVAAWQQVEAKPWKTRLRYGFEMEHAGALSFSREVHARFLQVLTLALPAPEDSSLLSRAQCQSLQDAVQECVEISTQLNDLHPQKRDKPPTSGRLKTLTWQHPDSKNESFFEEGVEDLSQHRPATEPPWKMMISEAKEEEETGHQESFTFVVWDEAAEFEIKRGRLLEVNHDVRQLCELMRQVHATVLAQDSQVQVLGDAIEHSKQETLAAEQTVIEASQSLTSSLHKQAWVVILGCVAATALVGFVPLSGFVVGAKALVTGKVGWACAVSGATYMGVTTYTSSLGSSALNISKIKAKSLS